MLSVIVTTYNRAQTLQVTLERLAAQTLPRDHYEVVVVDDGSPDDTGPMVAAYRQRSPYRLRYLVHVNRGPGYSQNRGIHAAEGPWILLLADDIQPEPNLLAVHYHTHEKHPEPHVAVAGKVLQSPDLPGTVFQRNWDPFRYMKFERFDELSYINFWACNVSFKKQFMLDYGMFVERAGAAHEDTEVGWRLYRDGGMRLLYRKDALAYHYHPETIDSACRRSYERGKNFGVLADSVDDPGLYVRCHILNRQVLKYFLQGARGAHASTLDEDRNTLWYVTREVLRRLLFNRCTVPSLILPMIRAAEHNRLLARLVTPRLIRGAVSYHFLRGLSELGGRQRSAPSYRPAQSL